MYMRVSFQEIKSVNRDVMNKMFSAPVSPFEGNVSSVTEEAKLIYNTYVEYTNNKTLPKDITFTYNISDSQYQHLNYLRYHTGLYTPIEPTYTNSTSVPGVSSSNATAYKIPFNTTVNATTSAEPSPFFSSSTKVVNHVDRTNINTMRNDLLAR
jgi:hypothetical protein